MTLIVLRLNNACAQTVQRGTYPLLSPCISAPHGVLVTPLTGPSVTLSMCGDRLACTTQCASMCNAHQWRSQCVPSCMCCCVPLHCIALHWHQWRSQCVEIVLHVLLLRSIKCAMCAHSHCVFSRLIEHCALCSWSVHRHYTIQGGARLYRLRCIVHSWALVPPWWAPIVQHHGLL